MAKRLARAPDRLQKETIDLNRKADHFENLIRQAFLRAVDKLGSQISAADLVRFFKRQPTRKINQALLKLVQEAFEKEMKGVIEKAYRTGGRMGEKRLKRVLTGG